MTPIPLVALPQFDGDLLISLAILLGILATASFISVYVYGRFAKRARGAESWSIPPSGEPTPADAAVTALTDPRPTETGVIVLPDNHAAFAARALSARAAGRSLDMMYYLWRGDLTGDLLIAEVLAAADRGARVRLLLDDINTRGLDPEYLALNGHSNIEVRLFNPAKNRTASLRRGVEMLLRLFTVTRRMHNKAWIVDGRLALIGGRNIGDTYFDAAADFNSSDMDALLLGPSVASVETIFDTYWNSPLTLPIRSLWKDRETSLRGFRDTLATEAGTADAMRYRDAALTDADLPAFLGAHRLRWTSRARVISDPPGKTQHLDRDQWLINTLVPMLQATVSDLRVTTAYFVPGEEATAGFVGIAERGVRVAILTNSLASTNQVTVHGGYSAARPPLLRAGVRLFELRPTDPDRAKSSLFGSAAASLHAKTFRIDGETGFIGSFNFDLRSAYLNTEMGLLVEDQEIAAEIDHVFARETAPAKSYEVSIDADGALRWRDGDSELRQEPEATRRRRLLAAIVRHLPIKSQL